jgi:hypothetical protein
LVQCRADWRASAIFSAALFCPSLAREAAGISGERRRDVPATQFGGALVPTLVSALRGHDTL